MTRRALILRARSGSSDIGLQEQEQHSIPVASLFVFAEVFSTPHLYCLATLLTSIAHTSFVAYSLYHPEVVDWISQYWYLAIVNIVLIVGIFIGTYYFSSLGVFLRRKPNETQEVLAPPGRFSWQFALALFILWNMFRTSIWLVAFDARIVLCYSSTETCGIIVIVLYFTVVSRCFATGRARAVDDLKNGIMVYFGFVVVVGLVSVLFIWPQYGSIAAASIALSAVLTTQYILDDQFLITIEKAARGTAPV